MHLLLIGVQAVQQVLVLLLGCCRRVRIGKRRLHRSGALRQLQLGIHAPHGLALQEREQGVPCGQVACVERLLLLWLDRPRQRSSLQSIETGLVRCTHICWYSEKQEALTDWICSSFEYQRSTAVTCSESPARCGAR